MQPYSANGTTLHQFDLDGRAQHRHCKKLLPYSPPAVHPTLDRTCPPKKKEAAPLHSMSEGLGRRPRWQLVGAGLRLCSRAVLKARARVARCILHAREERGSERA
eukprot:6740756-Prymnesium_polylepis.1